MNLRATLRKHFKNLAGDPEISLEDMIEEMINYDKNQILKESLLIKKWLSS